jgi:predicted aspartyl protease
LTRRKRLSPSHIFIGLMTLAAGATHAIAEEEKCHLYRIAQLEMSTDLTGRVNVPMTVNGQSVNLLIDTGGYVSTLTRYAVKSLGLQSQPAFRPLETYFGGEVVDHYVLAPNVDLGGMKGSKFPFFVMSNSRSSLDIGGTLAPDILRAYDVDFDFANSKFNLFSKDHCDGKVVYWTKDGAGRVEFHTDQSGHMVVPVLLDGKKTHATLDTGAADTVARFEAIESDLGIDEKNPALKLVPGRDPQRPRYRYPFQTLTFDDVTVNNPDITLVPDEQSKLSGRDSAIILGMNVLRRLHIYIAYGEKNLYVTPATAH